MGPKGWGGRLRAEEGPKSYSSRDFKDKPFSEAFLVVGGPFEGELLLKPSSMEIIGIEARPRLVLIERTSLGEKAFSKARALDCCLIEDD